MTKPFEGFDLTNFWEDSDYSRENYVEGAVTEAAIADVEQELGYRLPESYIALMKSQNGGQTINTCFPTKESTTWAADHVAIEGIYGIGRSKTYSLCGEFGSKFMQQEWGYPTSGICICDTPSAGHDMIMLDYSECGPQGEPRVVHVDQEFDCATTLLAPDFESFIRGLVNSSVYDRAEEERFEDLNKVMHKPFSKRLEKCLQATGEPPLGQTLRNLCHAITEAKGHFSLHADVQSLMAFDFLFYIAGKQHKILSVQDYITIFTEMIMTFEEGLFSLNGIAPDFVVQWWDDRLGSGKFIDRGNGLVFTDEARLTFRLALRPYEPGQYDPV